MTVEYLGNMALLEQEMVAFLAPSRVSPVAVLPTLDWASGMARSGHVVVSGFSSRLEQEVWDVLVRGSSPLVKVMVADKYKLVPLVYRPLLDSGHLLLVFLGLGPRINRALAARRNGYVASMATEVVFPSMHTGSSLYPLSETLAAEGKRVTLLAP